ncbi:MAG: NAD(P)-dependent oxidoreductase [Paracoccaceae bacterium]|nr:NAD(P)-dependent oxidoreductase [Paracoccaceae bacterium]
MRVFVSGAAGRVGTGAVAAFLKAGFSVTGFDVRPSGRAAAGYTDHVGELENPADVARAIVDTDIVIHLGAVMSWAPTDQARMQRANVEGTRVLLDAASQAGVRRFVFASSGEVYPETAPEILPITEDHPLKPNSFYGLTKLLGENLVRFHQRMGAMETVILRFAHTQDAEELLDEESVFSGPRFFLRPRIRATETIGNRDLAERLRRNDPGVPAHVLARNKDSRPYMMHITDTRDIVAGLTLAAEHPDAAGATFNLGATEPVEFGWLLERMSAITGYPVVPIDFPGPGVRYRTSNSRIRTRLGFEPQWTVERMLGEAAAARKARVMG